MRVEHDPEVGDGLADFAAHLQEITQSGNAVEYVKIHRLLGQGNFVVLFSEVKNGEGDLAVVDLFRLKNGKIVEHWDVKEKIGPQENWNNSGKF